MSEIQGYRALTEKEIDLINRIKRTVEGLSLLLAEVHAHRQEQYRACIMEEDAEEDARILAADAARWLAMAKTDLQVGIMKAVRAVAQPSGF